VGSIIELIIKMAMPGMDQNSSQFLLLRCLRFLRFLRVARMLRVKAFRELRLMVQSMMCCMKPLTWTVSLLSMVIYIFAIVFAQAVVDSQKEKNGLPAAYKLELKEFTTMMNSMYVLLSFVLGGTDWLQYAVALGSIGWGYKVCLCGYVIFTQLALLNVVTAIFVDSSMNAAMSDKQMVIQDEMMREGLNRMELEKLFNEASEGTGTLTVHQLRQYLEDEQVKTYLKVLEIHYSQPDDLVRVLDGNHDGTIDAQEFVKGCLKLKSQRMVDAYSAILENRKSFSVIKTGISNILGTLGSQGEKKEVRQDENDKGAIASNENKENHMQCDFQAAVFELQTAGSNFQIASKQLQDSRGTLQDLLGDFKALHNNLQSENPNVDRVSAQMQDVATSTHNMPTCDEFTAWQQNVQATQTLMMQQLDVILKHARGNVMMGLLPKSCTSTNDDVTETESRPTLPSPELTNRSFLEEALTPTDTSKSSPSKSPGPSHACRVKLATRLGPCFTNERSSVTAQGGDQDPPPTQPILERDILVETRPTEEQVAKPTRSCFLQNNNDPTFTCLSR